MKRLWLLLLGLVVVGALYLLFWPVPIEPQAWTPPPAPKLEGPNTDPRYAPNEKLKGVQRLADGYGVGPEGIAVDAAGRLYAGFADGRVVQFSGNGTGPKVLGKTGGRPLGIAFGPNGGVLVADAVKGLLLVGGDNYVEPLVTEAEDVKVGFADDVADSRLDKNVYFSDATVKFPNDYRADFLEHGPNGRLLRYNVETKETTVLARGLYFPNGVTLGPNEDSVLFTETAKFRVMRYWLKGEKAGRLEPFAENLPGFPDNLSFNGRNRIWVALFAPRDPNYDALLPKPALRKLVYRLPAFLQPNPPRQSFVLGFDPAGYVIANLQYKGPGAFAPITSVEEFGDWLYLGSLSDTAIGRLPLKDALAQGQAQGQE